MKEKVQLLLLRSKGVFRLRPKMGGKGKGGGGGRLIRPNGTGEGKLEETGDGSD